MKIVHVVEPFASGIATFVKSLVENLQDDLHIIVHGEREHLMSSAEVKQRFPKGNVRFIRWKSAQREISFRKDTAAFMELYSILKRLKNKVHIDAVHLHSSKSGFLGRVACKMAGIDRINSAYSTHAHRAAEIARDHFDAARVLPALLDVCGR